MYHRLMHYAKMSFFRCSVKMCSRLNDSSQHVTIITNNLLFTALYFHQVHIRGTTGRSSKYGTTCSIVCKLISNSPTRPIDQQQLHMPVCLCHKDCRLRPDSGSQAGLQRNQEAEQDGRTVDTETKNEISCYILSVHAAG